MVARVTSATLMGVEGYRVDVEVQTSRGTPQMDLVGLPEMAVRESRVRVRSAIRNCGYPFPACRLVVNMAPADVRKEGTYFDLPVAIGVLASTGVIDSQSLDGWLIVGELSLDGRLRPVRGILAFAELAKRHDLKGLLCPSSNGYQASLLPGLEVRAVDSLADAVQAIGSDTWPRPQRPDLEQPQTSGPCWSDVLGQPVAKRALEVAAAGGHNAVMVGSPGTGKTMLARRLPTILPALAPTESLAVTKIHSVVAGQQHDRLHHLRPFRAPHHTASMSSLVGGGSFPRPGEVTLAHHGVLFLDELPEFSRSALETLRQPLEDGVVTISRARQMVSFPCDLMLIAAMNPCACGWLGSPHRRCSCSEHHRSRYQAKVSGPLLDRIDVQVALMPLAPDELRATGKGEDSSTVRARVCGARRRQSERFGEGRTNANVPMSLLKSRCPMPASVHELLLQALRRFGLSPRAHDRVWRVSQSIADLAGESEISSSHVAEALQYRHFDAASDLNLV